MFSRILVPLDGSERAARALPVAARIARGAGAAVVLLRAVDIVAEVGAYYRAPADVATTLLAAEEDEATRYLTAIAGDNALGGIQTEHHVVVGSAGLAMLDAVQTQRADLIVMCSHGRRGLARWALGSVAEHVAHHAAVPVLVLRKSGPSLAGQEGARAGARALVPLDGSAHAEAALPHAVELVAALAAAQQGALHLVLVVPPYEADPNNLPDALVLEGAKGYLARVADRLRTAHPQVRVTTAVTVNVDPAAALIQAAEGDEEGKGEEGEGGSVGRACDLIAMATHGSGGIRRWVMGSVTDRVLRSTKLPVLVVRPPADTN